MLTPEIIRTFDDDSLAILFTEVEDSIDRLGETPELKALSDACCAEVFRRGKPKIRVIRVEDIPSDGEEWVEGIGWVPLTAS